MKLQFWDEIVKKAMECIWLKGRKPDRKSGWIMRNLLVEERWIVEDKRRGEKRTRGLRWVRLVTEGERAIIPTNSLRALQKEG